MNVVASSAPDDLLGTDGKGIVGRKVEHLGHVHDVEVGREHRFVPLDGMTKRAVVSRNLGKCEIGIDGSTPLLAEAVSIDINKSYLHAKR